ncbi:MAG: hypothetical protein ACREEM_39640 [Blastocatellia bacterium]
MLKYLQESLRWIHLAVFKPVTLEEEAKHLSGKELIFVYLKVFPVSLMIPLVLFPIAGNLFILLGYQFNWNDPMRDLVVGGAIGWLTGGLLSGLGGVLIGQLRLPEPFRVVLLVFSISLTSGVAYGLFVGWAFRRLDIGIVGDLSWWVIGLLGAWLVGGMATGFTGWLAGGTVSWLCGTTFGVIFRMIYMTGTEGPTVTVWNSILLLLAIIATL